MKKTLLLLTTLASLTIANTSHAQYYNFDVRVHQDTDWVAALPILEQQREQIARQNIQQFRQLWLYQLPEPLKRQYIYFIPGLGKALQNNDWAAACTFFITTMTQENAYIKAHHGYVSPGFYEAGIRAYAMNPTPKQYHDYYQKIK